MDRVNRKEITAATLRNYVKSIKLFCDMADLQIPWKKITRGLPKERGYAADRAPTIEEIRKIIEYPDRRIKAIVLVMASSGICLASWDYLKWSNIIPITYFDLPILDQLNYISINGYEQHCGAIKCELRRVKPCTLEGQSDVRKSESTI
jgi:hypothetical protein